MIFFTVGTQLPFPRMFAWYSEWKSLRSDAPGMQTIAQTCDSISYPDIDKSFEFLNGDAYRKHIDRSTFLVSHAGMGSVLSAMESGKPSVLLARQAKFSEHRNDHQMATCNAFQKLHPLLFFCTTREDFFRALDELHGSKIINGDFVFPAPTPSSDLIKLKQYLALQIAENS